MLAIGKLLLIGVPAVIGLVALSASDAHAATPSKAMPEALRAKAQAALATADPLAIRAVADEVEKSGFKEQAASMRAAADAIEAAERAVEPTAVPVSAGAGVAAALPGAAAAVPVGPVQKTGRVLVVKPGQGPFQVAQDALGKSAGAARWRELRDANIPRSADGIPRKWIRDVVADPSGQTFRFDPPLNPGDRLIVPASWPTTDAMKVDTIILSGDDGAPEKLRRLAARVALEITRAQKGQENRELIAAYQRAEQRRGRRRGRPHGLYDPETMMLLAHAHGIVPPTRFGDDSEAYYPNNPAPSKTKLRQALESLAERDEPRAEEWRAAAATV